VQIENVENRLSKHVSDMCQPDWDAHYIRGVHLWGGDLESMVQYCIAANSQVTVCKHILWQFYIGMFLKYYICSIHIEYIVS
jgi:hypothetical protein